MTLAKTLHRPPLYILNVRPLIPNKILEKSLANKIFNKAVRILTDFNYRHFSDILQIFKNNCF